ncbi:MAG: prolyl oligopeptidase family serine peptidase [Anaerolineae bacterium]|nr:prolyl oligopeptidase family serine peptidase [Anaerolineae bacterium]
MSGQRDISAGRRVRFVLRSVVIVTLALLIGLPCAMGFSFMASLTLPGCGPDADPADFGLPRVEVNFPSSEFDGQSYAGYFLPGTNGATVIVVPSLRSGRGDRMQEIAIYQRGGYNVLTYRARSCFNRPHSLGYLEVTTVGDALAYLQARPDVDPERIAVHGFSAGGATSLMAFARYPALKAAIAQGGYEDFDGILHENSAQLGLLGPLFRFAAQIAYRLTVGEDISVLSPISAVHASGERPVLLIYGSTEVTLEGAQAMQARAPERVSLWVVPGAGHGNYVSVAGEDTYGEHVYRFLEAALALDDDS